MFLHFWQSMINDCHMPLMYTWMLCHPCFVFRGWTADLQHWEQTIYANWTLDCSKCQDFEIYRWENGQNLTDLKIERKSWPDKRWQLHPWLRLPYFGPDQPRCQLLKLLDQPCWEGWSWRRPCSPHTPLKPLCPSPTWPLSLCYLKRPILPASSKKCIAWKWRAVSLSFWEFSSIKVFRFPWDIFWALWCVCQTCLLERPHNRVAGFVFLRRSNRSSELKMAITMSQIEQPYIF